MLSHWWQVFLWKYKIKLYFFSLIYQFLSLHEFYLMSEIPNAQKTSEPLSPLLPVMKCVGKGWSIVCWVQLCFCWWSCLQESSSQWMPSWLPCFFCFSCTSSIQTRVCFQQHSVDIASLSPYGRTGLLRSSPFSLPLLWRPQQLQLLISLKTSSSLIPFPLQKPSQTFSTWTTTHHCLPFRH